jgi:hypothetical protein
MDVGSGQQLGSTFDTMSLSRAVLHPQKYTAMKYIFVTKSWERPALLFQMRPSLMSLHAKFGGPRSSGLSGVLENVPEKLKFWWNFSLSKCGNLQTGPKSCEECLIWTIFRRSQFCSGPAASGTPCIETAPKSNKVIRTFSAQSLWKSKFTCQNLVRIRQELRVSIPGKQNHTFFPGLFVKQSARF